MTTNYNNDNVHFWRDFPAVDTILQLRLKIGVVDIDVTDILGT